VDGLSTILGVGGSLRPPLKACKEWWWSGDTTGDMERSLLTGGMADEGICLDSVGCFPSDK